MLDDMTILLRNMQETMHRQDVVLQRVYREAGHKYVCNPYAVSGFKAPRSTPWVQTHHAGRTGMHRNTRVLNVQLDRVGLNVDRMMGALDGIEVRLAAHQRALAWHIGALHSAEDIKTWCVPKPPNPYAEQGREWNEAEWGVYDELAPREDELGLQDGGGQGLDNANFLYVPTPEDAPDEEPVRVQSGPASVHFRAPTWHRERDATWNRERDSTWTRLHTSRPAEVESDMCIDPLHWNADDADPALDALARLDVLGFASDCFALCSRRASDCFAGAHHLS
jgi:hypothetical protein